MRFTAQVDLVGGDPRDIQEVVDQPHELADLTVDHFAGAGRARRGRAGLETLDGEPDGCERIPELVRQRREEFVLPLIRFQEFGGSIVDAELQIAVQGFGVVLRGLEALDEILIVESQLEGGFDHPMESPGRRQRRDGEQRGQESHHQVVFIPHARQTQGRDETGSEEER